MEVAQNLEDLINALFDCVTSNPSPELHDTIYNSLNAIGEKQSPLFLSVAHTYLLKHNRLSDVHRSFILNCITKVLDGYGVLDNCDEQEALLIINLATNEMTMTKDTDETWANSAKEVLVTLAKNDRFVGHVMDTILSKYPPGHTTSPHKYVVLSLAAISKQNPAGFLPYLTDVLSRTVPLLSHLKHDPLRSAWSQALCAFSDAVLDCYTQTVSNGVSCGSAPSISANDDSGSIFTRSDFGDTEFSDQFEPIYESIFSWTSSKDSRCRSDSVECVGNLCQMIPRQRIVRDLKKLVTMFLSAYKKTSVLTETLAITKGVANFLSACCSEETLNVEQYLDDIFNAFFPYVCVVSEQSFSEDTSGMSLNSTQIKIRNEAFRCFQIASKRFTDRQVYYLLHKMQSDKDSVKLGATNLMRHLLNSAGSQMEDKRSLITMGLKPLLRDETLSARVKMSICQLCVALADHGYVQIEAEGQYVIQFLLTNLILKVDPLTTSKKSAVLNEGVSMQHLHTQCAQALHTIANTCQSSFRLLWPVLFEYVCSEAYTPVITDILKCLRILTFRARESEQTLDFTEGIPTSFQVMSRLFVCMNGAPLNVAMQLRATEALKVFKEISIWFSPLIPEVVNEQLPQIMALIDDLNPMHIEADRSIESDSLSIATSRPVSFDRVDYSSLELKCARTQRWQAHILEFLNACVCAEDEAEWRPALAEAMTGQFHFYNDSSHDKAFLMRCLAQTLSRITNSTCVLEKMTAMFNATTHTNQIERVGCAMAVGHCAQTHTDLMLQELANVAKNEGKKSSAGGFLSFIKDAMPYGKTMDAEMIHLKATLVLCYGYVVYFCPVESVVKHIEDTVLTFLRQYVENCKDIVMREAHLEAINLIALTVHPRHLNSDYKFESRYECFSYIKRYVQAENQETLSSWVRLLAAKATSSLVQLDPPISDNELWDIGNILTQQTFPIGREKSGLKTLDPLSVSGFLLSPLISTTHLLSGVNGVSAAYPFESIAYAGHYRFSSSHLHPRSTALSDDSESGEVDDVASAANSGRQRLSLSKLAKTDTKKPRNSLSAAAVMNTVANGFSAISPPASLKPVGGSYGSTAIRIDDDEASTVMDATVMQYRNAIGHIVARQPCVQTVEQLLKMFVDFYGSITDHERTRSIDATCLVLSVYAKSPADCTLGRANDFAPLSNLLGRLAPRLSDSLQAVRILSIRAIWLSFKLSLLRRGHSPQDSDLVDASLFNATAFIDEYLGNEGKLDAADCRLAITAISKEIEKRLPQGQIQTYISVLFEMLGDRQNNVSISAAQLLSILMEERGHMLHFEAEKLVWTFLEQLALVHPYIQTYTELKTAFGLFAGHQQHAIVEVLLKQPLPYSITNMEAWQVMARDPAQFSIALDYLLDLMVGGTPPTPNSATNTETINASGLPRSGSISGRLDEDKKASAQNNVTSAQRLSQRPPMPPPPSVPQQRASTTSLDLSVAAKTHYEVIDIGAGMAVKVISSEACALVSAMKELIKSGEPEEALFSRIPSVLASLLQMLVAVIETQFPAAPRIAAAASSGSTTASTASTIATNASAISGGVTQATTLSGPNNSSNVTTGQTDKKHPPIINKELCRVASSPAALVVDVLKTLLTRIRADAVIEVMNSERAFTKIAQSENYLCGISTMCNALCDHRPKFIGPLISLMASRVTSACEAERTACVAVISSLITRCPKENGDFDPDLFVTAIKSLGRGLKDSKLVVRKLAIRGHGMIGCLEKMAPSLDDTTRRELLQKFSKIAVDAALIGLDDAADRGDQLAVEAVGALDALVGVADEHLLAQILPQLLSRIRPCFEKGEILRAAAFSLFAGLGANVGECDTFKESLHTNIVSILLHLNDSDEIVQCKCSCVLVSAGHILNSSHASTLIENEIVANKPVKNYETFLRDFSMILALSFSDRLNSYALNCANYFKSQSARIRQNAALMTGHLLASLTPELRGTLSKDLIFPGLVQLLKDPEQEVRITTARAIACLYAFA